LLAHCNADCSAAAPFCGDGQLTLPYEQCDDGETDASDAAAGDACGPLCECVSGINIVFLDGTSALSSGGGQSAYGYGLENMIDGHGQETCKFHWVSTSIDQAWFEIIWNKPVTIQTISIDTINAWVAACGAVSGRSLGSGLIQGLDGSSNWITYAAFDSFTDDWSLSLPEPIQTPRLRFYDIEACTDYGAMRNPVLFEVSVFSCE